MGSKMKTFFVCGECGSIISCERAKQHFAVECPNNGEFLMKTTSFRSIPQSAKFFVFEEELIFDETEEDNEKTGEGS